MHKLYKGFTFIEVLVGLVLLAFILLEFDGLQIVALKQTESNYFFRIANNELYAMYERLFVIKNNYGLSNAITHWQDQLKQELPNAQGKVSGQFPHYTIAISWGDISSCNKTSIGFSGCLIQEFNLPE